MSNEKKGSYSKMRVSFHDKDLKNGYDVEIDKANGLVENCSPPEAVQEYSILLNNLKNIKKTYHRNPIPEGFGLGLLVNHRARIDRRIEGIEGELPIHKERAEEYRKKEEQKREEDRERAKEERSREHDLAIENLRIQAQKDMYKEQLAEAGKSKTTSHIESVGKDLPPPPRIR